MTYMLLIHSGDAVTRYEGMSEDEQKARPVVER